MDDKTLRNSMADPQRVRDALERVDIETQDGDVGGYHELEVPLNLNAIAIGLGLRTVEYEPGGFPGAIFRRRIREAEVTVVVAGDGQLTTVDAVDEALAREAVASTVQIIKDLDTFDIEVPDESDISISHLHSE